MKRLLLFLVIMGVAGVGARAQPVYYEVPDVPTDLFGIGPATRLPSEIVLNNAGTYSENAYRKIGHAVTVNAVRVGGPNDTQTAAKTISAMIDLQPWKDPPQAYLPVDDPDALAKIKF